jgi:hypothetical protein
MSVALTATIRTLRSPVILEIGAGYGGLAAYGRGARPPQCLERFG